MKKFFSSSPLAVGLLAVGVIAIATGVIVKYSFQIPSPSRMAMVSEKAGLEVLPCVPRALSESPVGGLGRQDIPRLPGALRVSYDQEGQSTYSADAPESDIINYYLATLASQCWELSALNLHEVVWNKDGATMRLAVAPNSMGGKSLVTYEATGGKVLGYRLAQEASGTTCGTGQYYCTGSGCVPVGTECTSSGSGTGTGSGQSSSLSCSGSYQQPGSNSPSCNFSACPNGCLWGSDGCPSGCNPVCSGEYQQSDTTNSSCNYSKCPNGCTWSNGCPNGCNAPPAATCSGEYAQNGTYSCNTSKCPSGCSYDWRGCPNSCSASPSCSGDYQQPGATSPSCNYTKCTKGCNWSNGCPAGCYEGNTSGGTGTSNSTCGAGYYPCNGGCLPSGSLCSSPACPSGQYSCYNVCIPAEKSCEPPASTTSCPANQYWCNGACVAVGASCGGYPYYPPGNTTGNSNPNTNPVSTSQCSAGMYFCPAKNACIPTNDQCRTTSEPPQPPQPTRDTQCASDRYWCPSKKECVLNNDICPASGADQGRPNPPLGQDGKRGLDEERGKNDEDRARIEKERQKRMEDEEKRIDEERFRMMKNGINQFARGVQQMQAMVKRMEPRLTKLGVAVPPELKAALAKAPEIIEKIKKAETADELEELIPEIQDIGDAMQEWGPRFGDLMRLGEMMKRAGGDVKNIDRAIKRIAPYAKKNSALADAVAETTELGSAIRTALNEVKELAKTDPESALDKLQDEFYGSMEEFWNGVSLIDMVQNLSRGLSQGKNEIRRAEQKIKTLERKKAGSVIIAELKVLLGDIKGQMKIVETASKQRPVDLEELRGAAEELWSMVQEFESRMAEIGEGYYQPTIKRGEDIPFALPDAFDFGSRGGGDGSDPQFGSPSDGGGF